MLCITPAASAGVMPWLPCTLQNRRMKILYSLNKAARGTAGLALAALGLLGSRPAPAQTVVTPTTVTPVSLTAIGTPYTQDFNTLASTGSTSSVLPSGWVFVETAGSLPAAPDNTYSVNAGTMTVGNTYSYGSSSSFGANPVTDRAFGTFNGTGSSSNGTVSTIGGVFTNNTGSIVTGLTITYTGEQWRLGSLTRSTPDKFQFQYNLTGTDIHTGTFTDFPALDFTSPHANDGTTTQQLDGNLPANRAIVSATISGLSIPVGGTFALRWFDFDVTGGADDGLGVDDFSLTPLGGTPATVTTAAPAAAGATATVGGNVSSAGAGTVAGRGVVYSTTNPTPTVGGAGVSQLALGTGTGAFSGTLSGLTLGFTMYYVAAYATTSAGTAYGAVRTFTTGPVPVALMAIGTTYNQDFNALAASGTGNTKTTLPAGWDFVEEDVDGSGTADDTYSAGNPSTGNTYSLGASGSADRAFGTVVNGVVSPTIGAGFVNSTGQTITHLLVRYTGEQWRNGNQARPSQDRLDVQISTTAPDVAGSSGTYTDLAGLSFYGPNYNTGSSTGGLAYDGNAAGNRTNLVASVPVSIAPGQTFFLRWVDYNAPSGADDALGVDDFALTPLTAAPSLTISDAQTASGTFAGVTVTGTGQATLGAGLSVSGPLTVQAGGLLVPDCNPITGAGSFTLAADATLRICDPAGIAASGATGAVQVTGARSFAPAAFYEYVSPASVGGGAAAAQATGTGLPASVRSVVLRNAAGLSLTQPTTITQALTLTEGVLTTNGSLITLAPGALLTETDASYVLGQVSATRPVATVGTAESFGNLGLRLTPGAAAGASLPGLTTVLRTTGTQLTGVGSSVSVLRSFDVQAANPTNVNVALVFSYFAHELNGLAPATLLLFRSTGTATGLWAPYYNSAVSQSAGTVAVSVVNNLGLFTLGSSANPLPVELLDFAARADGPAVRLAWHTASEKNSRYFAIERSRDGGRTFEELGRVAARGNSTSRAAYAWQDDNLPGPPTLYYRLRQADADGRTSYSAVQAVQLAPATGPVTFEAYPTLLRDGHLHLRYQGPALGPDAVLECYSLTGQLLRRHPAPAVPAEWALPGLPAGSYLLRLRTAAGTQQARFVVE